MSSLSDTHNDTTRHALIRALAALKAGQYFKLICGGSFTEPQKVAALTRLYSLAGVDCIDIAPDENVLEAVLAGCSQLPEGTPMPLVMVSLPIDSDVHFRKIELSEPACILCDACIPVCPTDAITHPTDINALAISQPLCYGCSRCVDVCPTNALDLKPFQQDDRALREILNHPAVGAVEIHSRYADPYMVPAFLARFGDLLANKLVSLCFRPQEIPNTQWIAFLEVFLTFKQQHQPDEWPLILQIDGQPMSGSDEPNASLSSLQAAHAVHLVAGEKFPVITLSGGINAHTAQWLLQPEFSFIRGVGMGTVARQHVWSHLDDMGDSGLVRANELVQRFKLQKNRL